MPQTIIDLATGESIHPNSAQSDQHEVDGEAGRPEHAGTVGDACGAVVAPKEEEEIDD